MHPRNFGSERIVCTYYDVQKSVLHVHIRPIDLSITYNQPRVTSGYERFAWVFGTFDKITLRFAMNLFGDGAFRTLLLSPPPLPAVLGRRFLGHCFLGHRFLGRCFLGRRFLGRRFLGR